MADLNPSSSRSKTPSSTKKSNPNPNPNSKSPNKPKPPPKPPTSSKSEHGGQRLVAGGLPREQEDEGTMTLLAAVADFTARSGSIPTPATRVGGRDPKRRNPQQTKRIEEEIMMNSNAKKRKVDADRKDGVGDELEKDEGGGGDFKYLTHQARKYWKMQGLSRPDLLELGLKFMDKSKAAVLEGKWRLHLQEAMEIKSRTDQQIQQQQAVDRISQLPDDILLHNIMSLMTFQEACLASALSKRWRALFRSLPRLDLHPPPDYDDDDMERWLESVRLTLASRLAPVRICTILGEVVWDSKDFDHIVSFLCCHGIRELSVGNLADDERDRYTAPSCIYFCPTLTRIELSRCVLQVPAQPCLLPLLTALKLVECTVEDGDLQRLISGCPALERLTVENCNVVDAPNLAVLHVTTHAALRVSVANAPRLESVTVRLCYNLLGEGDWGRLTGLVGSLGDTQDLTLELKGSYHQILAQGVVVPVALRSLLPNLKRLALTMPLCSTFLLSFVSCLLNSCPNLDNLVIVDNYLPAEDANPNPDASVLNYWDQQMPPDCMRNTLRAVTLYAGVGYRWKYLVKLVKFLLDNGLVLEHLVIGFDEEEEELSKRAEDLHGELMLQLPPAPPDAVVRFEAGKSRMVYRPARLTLDPS